jgi:8-oxo-dGTP diphosphatase
MKHLRGDKCRHCGVQYLRNIAVDAVGLREEKLVLIKRGKHPDKGKWALPGGLLDWDESAKEAVVRELFEETGLSGKLGKFVGVYSDPERDKLQRVTIVYEVLVSKEKLQAGDDALDARWFSFEKLPKLAFDHNKIIEDYREKIMSRK